MQLTRESVLQTLGVGMRVTLFSLCCHRCSHDDDVVVGGREGPETWVNRGTAVPGD